MPSEPVNAGFCMLARDDTRAFRDGPAMSTLRQLAAHYAPLLLIDAASTKVQVGWISGTAPDRWACSVEEAGNGVFRCIAELAIDPSHAGAFVFCDGPGSILGIRTVAMAVRTWCVLRPRPVFAYHSLAVIVEALAESDLTVIADARRDSWHCAALGSPLCRVPTSELVGTLAMPEGFRHWTVPPAAVKPVSYSLADLFPRVMDADLFRATDAPDAFLHEEPNYAKWTPKIHRAP